MQCEVLGGWWYQFNYKKNSYRLVNYCIVWIVRVSHWPLNRFIFRYWGCLNLQKTMWLLNWEPVLVCKQLHTIVLLSKFVLTVWSLVFETCSSHTVWPLPLPALFTGKGNLLFELLRSAIVLLHNQPFWLSLNHWVITRLAAQADGSLWWCI